MLKRKKFPGRRVNAGKKIIIWNRVGMLKRNSIAVTNNKIMICVRLIK